MIGGYDGFGGSIRKFPRNFAMFTADTLRVEHFEIIFLTGYQTDGRGLLCGCDVVLKLADRAAVSANRDEVASVASVLREN